ncbi:MAG: aryl-sulfate sulfotransferase [Desulfobacteraceae bacterium]|jgi:DNA-binding beta-propeller fold protein YncE|nr:aryl-sulfate sulfotransferase [Desulfobacteraceae bacterium]
MKYIRYISGFFLIIVFSFGWGFCAGAFHLFPGNILIPIKNEITAFIQGVGYNKKSIAEKLANDLGLRPDRQLAKGAPQKQKNYQPLSFEGLKKRRQAPLIFTNDLQNGNNVIPSGYLFIWGAFDFDDHLHGGILIDEKGNVVHHWVPDEKDFVSEIDAFNKTLPKRNRIKYDPPQGRFPHGVVVFPDGSIIFNDSDPGNGMQKIDFCSHAQWIKLGKFNHVISKGTEDGTIWAMDKANFIHQLDTSKGESRQVIQIEDVIEANPDIDVLGIRRNYLEGKWLDDPWHFNDIEPLPLLYQNVFPQFNPGDLLLSMRSINALMVLDPETKKIKWWRLGACSRQHDPDWQPDGSITVYDNQMRDKNNINFGNEKFSRIIKINVDNYKTDVLYDGKHDNFYSNIRGKHQILPNGNILITSSMQGRVLIVNPEGETVYEFLNTYDKKGNVLVLSEAIWLPKNFFNFNIDKDRRCEQVNDSKKKWHPGQNNKLHFAVSELKLEQSILNLEPVPFETELPHGKNPFLAFEGWSQAEPDFRWSEGKSAYLHFKINKKLSIETVTLKLNIQTFGDQCIQIFLNEEVLQKTDIHFRQKTTLLLPLPTGLLRKNNINTLKFEFPDARIPDSSDSRALAVAFYSAEFIAGD